MVDAALALKKRGHEVEIFTSYHEDGKKGRSFEETRNGAYTLPPLYSILPLPPSQKRPRLLADFFALSSLASQPNSAWDW